MYHQIPLKDFVTYCFFHPFSLTQVLSLVSFFNRWKEISERVCGTHWLFGGTTLQVAKTKMKINMALSIRWCVNNLTGQGKIPKQRLNITTGACTRYKGKIFSADFMKTHSGTRRRVPVILNFRTTWKWMVKFMSWPFYTHPGERNCVPFP